MTNVKGRKLVIIADNPEMEKTTPLTKLYESKDQSASIIDSQ